MPDTFYKYAERNVESQINWGEVGRSVVDMLREETKLREEKKEAIDEATREQLETLKNAPIGDNEDLNSFTLNLSQDGQEFLLMNHRLLKSGQLNPKDFMLSSQNLNSNTNLMYETAKGLQSKYSEVMTRLQKEENQTTEVWLMEQVQNFAKFQGTAAKINPVTGNIELSEMVTDPKTGQKVIGKSISIKELANFSNIRLDKFDTDAANAKAVDGLGIEISSNLERVKGAYKLHSITEIEDITTRGPLADVAKEELAPYLKWESAKIEELLTNDYNRLSVLTEALGYSPTDNPDEAKADPKKVLIEKLSTGNIKPVFTEEQEKASYEYMKNDIRMRLDKKTTVSTVTEPIPTPKPTSIQEDEYERGKKEQTVKDLIGDFAMLYNGDAAQRKQAADSIISKSKGRVIGVEATDEGAVFYFRGGGSATRRFDESSEGSWVVSNVGLALPDDFEGETFDNRRLYEQAGGKGYDSKQKGKGSATSSIEQRADAATAAFKTAVSGYKKATNPNSPDISVGNNIFPVNTSSKEIAPRLNKFLSELDLPVGMQAEATGWGSGTVKVNVNGKTIQTINTAELGKKTADEKLNVLNQIVNEIDATLMESLGEQYNLWSAKYLQEHPATISPIKGGKNPNNLPPK